MMKFSVLMSIYHKEKPEYFNRCMQSIWDEQSVKPNQIVLVEDGKLTPELYEVIDKWKQKLDGILVRVPLKKNVGLGVALNIGLQKCSFEIVARMDTDDISTKDRFKKQIEFLEKYEKIDVVGTFIQEIDENEITIKEEVRFPINHKELFVFFKKRNPIAHPTAMLRKSYFEKSGGYPTNITLAEDTLLWFNGFLHGCQFANLDFIGLKFRRTSSFYLRRGDCKKLKDLLKYRIFIINKQLNYDFRANFYAIAYFLLCISPTILTKFLYKHLR